MSFIYCSRAFRLEPKFQGLIWYLCLTSHSQALQIVVSWPPWSSYRVMHCMDSLRVRTALCMLPTLSGSVETCFHVETVQPSRLIPSLGRRRRTVQWKFPASLWARRGPIILRASPSETQILGSSSIVVHLHFYATRFCRCSPSPGTRRNISVLH